MNTFGSRMNEGKSSFKNPTSQKDSSFSCPLLKVSCCNKVCWKRLEIANTILQVFSQKFRILILRWQALKFYLHSFNFIRELYSSQRTLKYSCPFMTGHLICFWIEPKCCYYILQQSALPGQPWTPFETALSELPLRALQEDLILLTLSPTPPFSGVERVKEEAIYAFYIHCTSSCDILQEKRYSANQSPGFQNTKLPS